MLGNLRKQNLVLCAQSLTKHTMEPRAQGNIQKTDHASISRHLPHMIHLYTTIQYHCMGGSSTPKGTFTLCPFQYQSPCQSPCPCPMKNQFIRKSEVLFRLHQFPYPYPNQCHPISIRSVSIGPPTVKNWYGRPILSVSGPETCIQGMLHQYLHFKIS